MHRKSYRGEEADIFSSGMMTFIMLTKSRPFAFALPKDPNYRCFGSGNPVHLQNYWDKILKKTEQKQPVSVSLRTFFEAIFQLDPKKRPTLNQLKQCEWMQGTIVSSEELFMFLK